MNLGTTIKKLRKQRGLKQFEFAERANITAAYLSLVETGQREPSLDFLKKISEVLSLPIPVIFFLSLDESDVPPNKRQAFEIVRKPVLAMIDGFFFSDYVEPETYQLENPIVGESVLYCPNHATGKDDKICERGKISKVEKNEDGTWKIWVRYNNSETGQLSPAKNLFR